MPTARPPPIIALLLPPIADFRIEFLPVFLIAMVFFAGVGFFFAAAALTFPFFLQKRRRRLFSSPHGGLLRLRGGFDERVERLIDVHDVCVLCVCVCDCARSTFYIIVESDPIFSFFFFFFFLISRRILLYNNKAVKTTILSIIIKKQKDCDPMLCVWIFFFSFSFFFFFFFVRTTRTKKRKSRTKTKRNSQSLVVLIITQKKDPRTPVSQKKKRNYYDGRKESVRRPSALYCKYIVTIRHEIIWSHYVRCFPAQV